MRKGEIACYKQFLLFSQCFPQLYILNASKCGIVWYWVNCKDDKNDHYNNRETAQEFAITQPQ